VISKAPTVCLFAKEAGEEVPRSSAKRELLRGDEPPQLIPDIGTSAANQIDKQDERCSDGDPEG
jgi:hypothetical protein